MKVRSQSFLGEKEIWGADIHVFQLDAANEINENDLYVAFLYLRRLENQKLKNFIVNDVN
jgi:hypothetical protein